MRIITITLSVLLFAGLFSPLLHASEGMLTATGWGTVDPSMAQTEAQARMLARRAARLDAQRQLSEMVKGVELRAGSTVEEYEVKSDIIATRVKNWLRGAVVIKDTVKSEEGTWVAEVEMGLCLTNEATPCKDKKTLKDLADEVDQNP